MDAVADGLLKLAASQLRGTRRRRFLAEVCQALCGGSTRTAEGFAAWTGEWVTGVRDRGEYLRKLGPRWQALRIPSGGED